MTIMLSFIILASYFVDSAMQSLPQSFPMDMSEPDFNSSKHVLLKKGMVELLIALP